MRIAILEGMISKGLIVKVDSGNEIRAMNNIKRRLLWN